MFVLEEPPLNQGADISVKSFEIIQDELKAYPSFDNFSPEEQQVIVRLIHTTACFNEVLENIFFTPHAIAHTQELLQHGATIIVDVNMIKVGLSEFYTQKYENNVVCYVNEPFIFEKAKHENTTRSYAGVRYAIGEHKDSPLVLVCGNAPTFIYAAIKGLQEEQIDMRRVSLLLFPVGFVNVIESKMYAERFCEYSGCEAIIMRGRFGSSTMAVATLHALYKGICDYDMTEKYNGK